MTQQNTQVSESDMELLSAYLDKQLPEAERRALDARMEREPALRATFDELGATVMLLRELPALTPPRSFTIDTATVQPRPWLSLGLLRFGSTFAALLFAVALVIDVTNSGVSVGGAGAPQNSAPVIAMDQRSAAGATAPTAASMALESTSATAAPAASDMLEDTSATGAAESTAGNAADTQSTGTEATVEAPVSALSASASEEAKSSTQNVEPAADTAALEQQEIVETPPNSVRPIRVIESGLALVAIALALAAWWLRRSAQV